MVSRARPVAISDMMRRLALDSRFPRLRLTPLFVRMAVLGGLSFFAGVGFTTHEILGVPSFYAYAGLWFATYVLAFLQPRWWTSVSPVMLVLPALALVSALLSDAPASALPYAAMFGLSVLVGAVLSHVATAAQVLDILWKATAILGLVGLAGYSLDLPGFRLFDGLGRTNVFGLPPFNGLFSHKTDAGRAMICGLIALLFLQPRRWPLVAGLLCFLLLLSGSVGAILFGLSCVAVGGALILVVPFSRTLSALIVVLWSLALLLVLPQLDLTQGLIGGRDLSSLTGRTGIWMSGLDAIWDRPWLGFGYFHAVESPYFLSRLFLLNDGNYLPPHFHNNFFQFLMDMGFLGLAAFVLTVCTMIWRLARKSGPNGSAPDKALLLITMFLLANGLTEVTFAYNTLGSVLVGFVLSRKGRRHSR